MEFMERGSLEDQLAVGLPSVAEAISLAREMAVALAHAHGKGILHCDLKPANVLLDQDNKPRLADFGQARLTHEQSPALGTLFYMAPEQADLKAAPDVRWDVYALGAILYHLLTGRPPYQSDELSAELRQAPNLEERLRRYRNALARAPRPVAHRHLPGVDRRLADIIDRCLTVRPDKRFGDAHAVLQALDERALARARRPVLVLGVGMPLLVLLVLALFGWRAFAAAVKDSEEALSYRAQLGNRFAARFAAANVARQMDQRWAVLEQESPKKSLAKLVAAAAGKKVDDPERQGLQNWLDQRRQQYLETTSARAWFVLDAQGRMLAVSPLAPSRHVIGENFAWRSYFHGGKRDLPKGTKGPALRPIERASRSVVFEASGDEHAHMVVFSVPVRPPDSAVVGVLGMGVELGDFTELRPRQEGPTEETAAAERWAVLVETGEDWEGGEGLVLQHPWLAALRAQKRRAPSVRLPAEQVQRLRQLRQDRLAGRPAGADAFLAMPTDPVRAASAASGEPWSADYTGPWLAAAEPVLVYPRRDGEKITDTGWVVVVQERSADALAPVQELRHDLRSLALQGLAVVVLVMAGLWAFVTLLQAEPRGRALAFLRRRAGLPTASSLATAASQRASARSQKDHTWPN
jgi:hypothetical protein